MLPLELPPPTGLSSWTFSFWMSFVFDVDCAGFLVALCDHLPMTSGKHVGCDCSFCAAVTFTKHHGGKERLRHPVVTNWDSDWRSIITHEHVVCGDFRHAAKTRLMVWSLCSKNVRSDDTSSVRCVNLCCSTSCG